MDLSSSDMFQMFIPDVKEVGTHLSFASYVTASDGGGMDAKLGIGTGNFRMY